MSRLPKIAIVGRPNVGKSALFNRICKKRLSIVDEAEGVTRDRLYAKTEFFGHPFELIDTAGLDMEGNLPFAEIVRRQTEIAIEEADSLIMVVDAQVGLTSIDEEVASLLRSQSKPVTLAVNKVDDSNDLSSFYVFHKLGFDRQIAVSGAHGFQIAELVEMALKGLVLPEEPVIDLGDIKVAVVGRPNVGKSTLVNYLLQDERCLVSPMAGTTRDSVDATIEVEGTLFTLIDTAGIRRKKSEHDAVDKFAALRTESAIERADVCLLMLSAEEGVTAQEKKLAREIERLGKGCILLFNKWDLVKGFRMEHCLEAVHKEVAFLQDCPAIFTSATTGRNLDGLFKQIKEVYQNLSARVTTGQLNKFIEQAVQRYHPPMLQGKRLRLYYATQVGIHPPRFVFFVNNPDLMVDSYKKYLLNAFREVYGFRGVPLNISLKSSHRAE